MKWKKNIKNVLFLLLIPLEFYEYNRMAFGLANAPATYQAHKTMPWRITPKSLFHILG